MSVWGGGGRRNEIDQVRFGCKATMGEVTKTISEYRIGSIRYHAESHARDYFDYEW
jgi:hypothetical protein